MNSWRERSSTKGSKQSWKRTSKSHAGQGGKYWSTQSKGNSIISRRSVRLFVALTSLLAASGFFVLYLARQDTPTPIVSIATIDYKHPWAPNGWASEDQQILKSLVDQGNFTVSAKTEGADGTWKQLIKLELDQARPGGPGGSFLPRIFGYRSLILHLSAHGVLNKAANPCLLFSDAEPLNDDSWVTLSEVLTAIGDHPVVRNGDVRLLVILDSGKQTPDFRCGLLSSGFIKQARDCIEQLPYPNMAVMLPCDAGQIAWTAPELGCSVLGSMVASGLLGHADDLSGDGNRRVSVSELSAFVDRAVSGYVHEFRGLQQSPSVVWSGGTKLKGDFELCYASKDELSRTSIYQSDIRINRLTEGWQTLQRWSSKHPSCFSWPRATALARLSRAEQLMWAGSAYEDQFEEELDLAMTSLQGNFSADWPSSICGASLAFLETVTGASSTAAPTVSNSESGPENADHGDQPQNPLAKDSSSTSDSAADASSNVSGESNSETKGPDRDLIAWLTFDEKIDEEDNPPVRPNLDSRSRSVEFLYHWFSENPEFLNATVMRRLTDWLGPLNDGRQLTREEALLRTISDHLQRTESWNMASQRSQSSLWSRFLKTAWACEQAATTTEMRTSKTLELISSRTLADLQLLRDKIHGCETDRDVSECAEVILSLEAAAKHLAEQKSILERGWRLQDELAFELPIISQWLTSPLARMHGRNEGEDPGDGLWQSTTRLTAQTVSLNEKLLRDTLPTSDELDEIETSFDTLRSTYAQELFQLVDTRAASQRDSLTNMWFSVGLRPTIFEGMELSERAALHRDLDGRFQDLAGLLTTDRLSSYCEIKNLTAATERMIWSDQFLPDDYATTCPSHYFAHSELGFSSLVSATSAASLQARLSSLGGELREFWADYPNVLLSQCSEAISAMNGTDQDSIAVAERKLMQSGFHGQLISQSVPVTELPLQRSPSKLVMAVSRQRFALWQARRSLTDFWKTPELPLAADRYFMLASSADWQQAAKRIFNAPDGPIVQAELRHLAVAQRAETWRQVLANIRSSGERVVELEGDLNVSGFPSGRAWIQFAKDGNRSKSMELTTGGQNRLQIEVRTGRPAEILGSFEATTPELPEGNHELIAWFRGHESYLHLPVYQLAPPLSFAWNVEPPAETTIRVNADPTPARIVFILDCSGSMSDTSLEVAKRRLVEVIEELPLERSEIAVLAFGHSAEYARKSNLPDLREPVWNAYRPNQVRRPYNDVELLLPLRSMADQFGVVDQSAMSKLRNDLSNLRSWGRTPLYEAILQANALLGKEDSFEGSRKIVAITDGENSVIPRTEDGRALTAGNWNVPGRYIHSMDSVKRKVDPDVVLEIVPYNFRSGNRSQQQLRELATHTGGGVRSANDESLADQLRRSLSPEQFTVSQVTPDSRQLGKPLPLTEKQDVPTGLLPAQFEVAIEDTAFTKPLALVGGETIELQYRRNQGLSFRPYQEGDTRDDFGVYELGDQRYKAIMLTGIPRNVPQIRMCLQSTMDAMQSIRPPRYLVELRRTKAGETEAERLAWTSNAQWENGHRTPVLRLPILNAPQFDSGRLEVRLWTSYKSAANETNLVPLARFREEPVSPVPGGRASIEVSTEQRQLSVRLTEIREQDASLVYWTFSPEPDQRVEHKFYAGKIVHELIYSDPTVLGQILIGATSMPPTATDEWQATQWIRVPRW